MSTSKESSGKGPRNEVISVRLTPERLELLERYQRMRAAELGREVSLGEAAFLALEEKAVDIDRSTARHLLLTNAQESLAYIRRQWTANHALTAAEWDVVIEYMKIATEEDRAEPSTQRPAIPSRTSYLAVLDAFEAVYRHRVEHDSPHTWAYFGNLGGFSSPDTPSETDAEQRDRTLLAQIARARADLQTEEGWKRPGNVGRCLQLAVREEGVEAMTLDHLLTPYWSVIWGLAARGHMIRYGLPVRASGPAPTDVRRTLTLPSVHEAPPFKLAIMALGLDLIVVLELGPARRSSFAIKSYPELAAFRAILEGLRDQPWTGRFFSAHFDPGPDGPVITLVFKAFEVRVEFTRAEWTIVRDLFREVWTSPQLRAWVDELRQEFGEWGEP